MSNPSSMTQAQFPRPLPGINWGNTLFLTITGLIALIGMPLYIYLVGVSWSLIGPFLFYMAATGFSITAGYHRLFAHRSYDANCFVKLFFLLFGAAACENSALKWAVDHRYHHRFVDQDADPYSIRRGFFHAHIGWVLLKRPQRPCLTSAADLSQDRLVRWQHRYYFPLAIFVGGFLPLLIGYSLGDALGCFLLAGVTRTVIVHHSTFLINSLCHFVGRQPYSVKDSSRDSVLAAVLTLGEGYHNFHHRFQYDFRNGVRWFHFDPTKWFIKVLEAFGFARNLRRASDVHVFKARLDIQKDQAQQKLTGLSRDFRAAMEQKIHATHKALVAAYASWRNLKAEYRSVGVSVDQKRKKLLSELKRELQGARSQFVATRASWTLLVRASAQAPT